MEVYQISVMYTFNILLFYLLIIPQLSWKKK